ncbi:MAG: hypothetical protein Q8P67_14220, partial [archaeon]|nr:hypothetical protein [archaeon]
EVLGKLLTEAKWDLAEAARLFCTTHQCSPAHPDEGGSPSDPTTPPSSAASEPNSPQEGGGPETASRTDSSGDGSHQSNGRRFAEEDSTMDSWKRHKKHIFVLSSAGKPIYSRYGSEDKLSGTMGVLSALVSFGLHDDDALRSIEFGDHLIVFCVKGPFYLVSASRTGEPQALILRNLEYVYNQILSILTGNVVSILSSRPNFDIRHLLGGCEKVLDSITSLMDHDLGLSCDAIHCLRFHKDKRQQIGNIIQTKKCADLLFGIVFCRSQLIQLVRPRKHIIAPSDLHLIFNFINSSSSFRTAESWTPICLPQFNSRGYLHAYVCFLSEDVCLVLISAKPESFYEMSACKGEIVAAFETAGLHKALEDAVTKSSYNMCDIQIQSASIPLHFVYISLLTRQITHPAYPSPYTSRKERKRLFRSYQQIHHQVTSQKQRLHFYVGERESILAISTPTFKLFTTFGPLELKTNALQASSNLLRWIKQEESSLFILNSPVF